MTPFVPHSQLNIPRVTGQLLIAGPKTFRKASRKVLGKKSTNVEFGNWGQNMQNWEKKLRRLIIADDGYVFVNRDQSGADAKIVAYLCTHGPYRELFLHGIKPHTYIALHLFPDVWKKRYSAEKVIVALATPISKLQSLPFWKELASFIKASDDWAPTERYYYFGKKIAHAFSYGMRGEKLAMVIMQETQAEVVLDKHTADMWILRCSTFFPEIQNVFQHRVMMAAKMKSQLRNLFNFPFNITYNTEKLSQNQLNELYSWIPQSTVACLNSHAYVLMQDYIEEHNKDWHILADTHDSITMEAPEGESEECAKKLKEFYESKELVSPVDKVTFRMSTECQIGKSWTSYDPEKAPEGMREVKL